MSRVYGSVTNNNGFWIGRLDLLTPSCTISLNHNQLQQLTINDCLRLAPFSFSLSVLILVLPQQLWNSAVLYPLCMDPKENTACIVHKACLPHRCLAIDLLLFHTFHTFASEGMCLTNHCLAMGMARTT
jgi:hypothetical protein